MKNPIEEKHEDLNTEKSKQEHSLIDDFSPFEQIKSLIQNDRGYNKFLNNALTKSYCNNASIIIVLIISIEIMNLNFDYSETILQYFIIMSVVLVIAEIYVFQIWSNLEDIEQEYKNDLIQIQFQNQMWLSLSSLFFKLQQMNVNVDYFKQGRFLAALGVIKVENLIMSFNLRGLFLLQELVLTIQMMVMNGNQDRFEKWMTLIVIALNVCQFQKMYITQRDNQAQLDEQEFRTKNSYLFFHDMRNQLYSSTCLLKENFLEALELENMTNSNVQENVTVLESNVKVSENLKQLYSCELFFNMTFQCKPSKHDTRSIFEFINNKIRVHLINKKFKVNCRLAKNALSSILVDKQLLFVFVLTSMMAIIDLKVDDIEVDSMEITYSTKQLKDQQYFTIKFETDSLLKTEMWNTISTNHLMNRMMRNINKEGDPVKQHFVNFEEFFELRFTQPKEEQTQISESVEEVIQYNRHKRAIANQIALVDDNEDMADNLEQMNMIRNKVAKAGSQLKEMSIKEIKQYRDDLKKQSVVRSQKQKNYNQHSLNNSIQWQQQPKTDTSVNLSHGIVTIVNANAILNNAPINRALPINDPIEKAISINDTSFCREIKDSIKEIKNVIDLAEVDIQVNIHNSENNNITSKDIESKTTNNLSVSPQPQKGDKLKTMMGNATIFSSDRGDDKSKTENQKLAGTTSTVYHYKTNETASELKNSVFINVDDESSILNLNKKLFGKLGHFLICCGKGTEFQDVLRKMQNDKSYHGKKVLAIMDQKLDGEFGDEIIKEATYLHSNFAPVPYFELKFVALSSTEDKHVITKLNDVKCLKIYPKPLKKAMIAEFKKFIDLE